MARNSYYNYGKVLKQMFPEQTKTNLHLIIWLLVFIADMVAVYFLLTHFGYTPFGGGSLRGELYLFALIGGGLLIFWLETVIYNKIHALFR